jgi:hypothetical protein
MDINKIVSNRVTSTIVAHDLDSKVLYHEGRDLQWILTAMVQGIFEDISLEIARDYKKEEEDGTT